MMNDHGLRPSLQSVVDNHVGRSVIDSILEHCARVSGEKLHLRPCRIEPGSELFEVDAGIGRRTPMLVRPAPAWRPGRLMHLRFHFRTPLDRTDLATESFVRALAALDGPLLWTVTLEDGRTEHYLSAPRKAINAALAIARSSLPWCELEIVPHLLDPDRASGDSVSLSGLLSLYSRSPYPLLMTTPASRAAAPTRLIVKAMHSAFTTRLVYQVLFRSIAPIWTDNCRRIATAAKHAASLSPIGPHLSLAQQLAHDGPMKAEEGILFAAVIRLAAFSRSRAEASLESAGALLLSQRQGTQPFMIHRLDDHLRAGIDEDHLVQMLSRGTSHSLGIVLSPREILQFVEPPGEELVGDRSIPLRRLRGPHPGRVVAVDGPLLGYLDAGSIRQPVRQPEALRTRHTLLIGVTGTGKSSTLGRLVLWDIEHENGVIVIDMGGDLIPTIAAQVPPHLSDRVVYLNPGLPGYSIAYNHLDLAPGMEASMAAERAVAVDRGLFDATSWGPNIETGLNLAYAALISGGGCCRADLPVLFGLDAEGRSLRASLLEHVRSPVVARFLEHEIERLPSDLRARIVGKVKRLLAHELLRRILSQRQSKFSLRDMLDRGMAVLIDLPPNLGLGVTSLTASLFTNDAFCAALSRADQDPDKRRPGFLYVDEVQRLLEASYLDHCLQECRKFRIGVHLAFQYADQLPTDLRAAICNAATIMAFGVRRSGAERLSRDFGLDVPIGDLMFQEPGQAIVRMDGKVMAVATPKPPATRRSTIPEAILRNSIEVAYVSDSEAATNQRPDGPEVRRSPERPARRSAKSRGWDEI